MPAPRPHRLRATCLVALGALVFAGGAGAAAVMHAQATTGLPAGTGHVAQVNTRARPASPAPAAPRAEAAPTWNELATAQKQALAPLQVTWSTLSEGHKRKWIALSQNYGSLPPPEKARLHSRMAEWAALSPQQRTQARLNFAETQKLPADDRKAKWEAYQALSADEKRRLAAGAQKAKPPAPTTAAAVQPVPAQKLTRPPAPQRPDARTPRIAGAAEVDHHTLLPPPGALTVQP